MLGGIGLSKAFWQAMSAGALQVETSILAERQALEMPCVAPSLVGRPHRHAYYQSSRIAQACHWGPPQVLHAPAVDCSSI